MIMDLSKGDRLHFVGCGSEIRGQFTVESEGSADPLELKSDSSDVVYKIARLDYAVLQASGGVIRLERQGVATSLITAADIKVLQQPLCDHVEASEIKAWQIRRRDITRAATLLFYARCYDNHPFPVSKRTETLERFLLSYADKAKEAGWSKCPSASALRKALAKGRPGQRSLGLYLRKKGAAVSRSKWDQWVYEIGQKMVAHYWSDWRVKFIDAHKWFDTRYYQKLDELKAKTAESEGKADEAPPLEETPVERSSVTPQWPAHPKAIEPPVPQTLTNWIHAARSHATVKSKWGTVSANRQLRGRGSSLEAIAPLEVLVLDATVGDIWAVEELQIDGSTKIVLKRPYIVWAMDLYSRMVPGMVMTFEPPSVATLMACLRNVMKPKVELIERFGEAKGATDGFGLWQWLILDNALENIGVSLQLVGDVVGFQVDYAPIRTPEYKPWIERLIRTMNSHLHSLPGGIPYPPDELRARNLDPRKAARLSLQDISELTDHKIIEYHLEVHNGIGMAPARRWSEGLIEFGRRTIDDARSMNLILGRYASRVLTASGIEFDGHVFHDQVITSMLLNDMARMHRERGDGDQTVSFRVHFFYDPMNVTSISVINEHTKEIVELPNSDEFYAATVVSFVFAAGERAAQVAANKRFHTREDKARFRIEYERDLAAKLASDTHGEGKRTIRKLYGGSKGALELVPGDRIVESDIESSISGMPKARDIPVKLALKSKSTSLVIPKGRKVKTKKKRNAGTLAVTAANDPRPALSNDLYPLLPDDVVDPIENIAEDTEAMLDELDRLYNS
ncbi:hypothetical protein ACCS55_09115 [Rhizobium ruizarguesonis]